jgi:hypothetical protein
VQFLRAVRPDQIRALVADREFTGSDFLEMLKEQKVSFVVRLRSCFNFNRADSVRYGAERSAPWSRWSQYSVRSLC